MDKREVIEKVKRYSDLVNIHFPTVKLIILYGSYAKSIAKKHSDIDIAVVVDKIDDDFLMLAAQLYKLRREIDARIEPILLEENNDKSGFLEQILKDGEIIYNS